MAGKTKINGTAYTINGGKCKVNGTAYSIKGGKTLIGGTAKTVSFWTAPRVGGRIFYDAGDNGATYTFYDYNKNVISTQTISGLANAYYYTISGTPTKDRWYVYDNTTGLVSSKSWGTSGTSTGTTTDTIGSGKTNTARILASYSSSMGSMWTWLRDTIRGGRVGGCNDWFIASKAEQLVLRSSGLVNWYEEGKYIWSSVERTADYAWAWYHDTKNFGLYGKGGGVYAFAVRAF